MRNNLKRLSVIVLLVAMCLISILSVSAATIGGALTNGKSISLQEKSLANPRTIIDSLPSGSTSAVVSTKLEKKGLVFWSKVGTVVQEVIGDDYKSYDWKVSGTNDIKATWTDESNAIGYGIAADFTLTSR